MLTDALTWVESLLTAGGFELTSNPLDPDPHNRGRLAVALIAYEIDVVERIASEAHLLRVGVRGGVDNARTEQQLSQQIELIIAALKNQEQEEFFTQHPITVTRPPPSGEQSLYEVAIDVAWTTLL